MSGRQHGDGWRRRAWIAARRDAWPKAARSLLLVALASGTTVCGEDEAAEAAIRTVTLAVTERADWSPVGVLALRQLESPSLRPLFYQLVQSPRSWLQVHGVLGVAELDPERRLDPWLLGRVAGETQELVITEALDAGLVDDTTIDALLRWDGLEPLPRLLLWAERVHDRPEPDVAALAALLNAAGDDADPRLEPLAICMLAQRGDPSAIGMLRSLGAELPPSAQAGLLRWTLEAIRQYRLAAALPVAELTLERYAERLELASAALLALLHLEPARGLDWWIRLHASSDRAATVGGRVRYAMLLLDAAESVPVEAFDRLGSDLVVVDAIAAVGRALSRGDDPTASLVTLLDLEHGPSSDWIMGRLERMPTTRARAIATHLIETLPADPSPDRMARAVAAASVLAGIDLDDVLARLESAEDDSLVQQALMIGLLGRRAEPIGRVAESIPRRGPGKADSIALLLLARNVEQLAETDRRRLGVIAAGGGRVGEMLRVQACWLYLEHAGLTEAALGRIFTNF